MKKLTLFAVMLLTGFGIVLTSCNKDDDNNPSESSYYILNEHLIETELPCFVNIMFEVSDAEGKGVPDLVTSDFRVFEDDQAVSPTESAMTIKKKDAIDYTIKTVLLIDNSASVGSNLNEIKTAAINLVNNIVSQQEIAVYVFSEEAVLIQDFTSNVATLISAINNISLGYATTNLYGSIVTGASRWEDFYSTTSIQQGFMITLTDGSDTQGSTTLSEALAAIEGKKVFTVGLGSEQDVSALKQLGTAGYYSLENYSELSDQFREIQDEISANANSFYFLYYMSPKRGNIDHTISLSIYDNTNNSSSGFINGQFNSDGFYSVQQSVVINDGVELIQLFPGNDFSLTATTYLPVNNPSYTWQSSNSNVVSVTVSSSGNDKAVISAVGSTGQSATITVNDVTNSLSETITVNIVESPYSQFTDPRDGQTYDIITIGNQTWFAENLRFNITSGCWVYDDNESNVNTYGLLYNKASAAIACPDGWHLPSGTEWNTLVDYLGGPATAGGSLKEAGTVHWKVPNVGATNSSYFTALPGGMRTIDGNYISLEESSYFWSSTQSGVFDSYFRRMDYDRGTAVYGYLDNETGLSVRCIRD